MKLFLRSGIVIVLIMLAVARQLCAQQNILFNTWQYDPMQLNIAYAAQECVEANLNYRNQWMGLKGAPTLYQLNAHTPLPKNTGLGLRIASRQTGLLNTLQTCAGYGYQLKIDKRSQVLLGIGIGFTQNILSSQKAVVIDANDATLSQGGKQRALGFDSELGAQYIGEKLKAGVSVLHLYNSNPDFTGSAYKLLPQMNLCLSYLFNKDKQIGFEPMLVDRLTIKGDNVIDAMFNVHFNKLITAGLGYRSNYGLLTFIGVKTGKLKIAYSFDYGTSKNRTHMGASHQILLGFNYCKKQKIRSTKNKKLMRTRF